MSFESWQEENRAIANIKPTGFAVWQEENKAIAAESPGSYAEDLYHAIGRGGIRGIGAFPGALASVMEAGSKMPYGDWGGSIPGLEQRTSQRIQQLRKKARDIRDLSEAEVLRAKKGGKLGFAVNLVGEAIPQFAVSTVSALLGGPAAVVAVSATTGGEEVYQSLIDLGVDPEKADTARWITAPIIGLLEKWQIDEVLKVKNPAVIKQLVQAAREKSMTKLAKAGGQATFNEAMSAAAEGLQEALQEVTQIGAEVVLARDFDPTADIKRTLGAFGAGAFVGEAFRGAGGTLRGISSLAKETKQQSDVEKLKQYQLQHPRADQPIEATEPETGPGVLPPEPEPILSPEAGLAPEARAEAPLVPVEGTTKTEAPDQMSFRNADLETIRRSAGLPLVEELADKQTTQQRYDQALAEGYGEVNAAVDNARQILEEGRPASDLETHGMWHATNTLRGNINQASQAILDNPVDSSAYQAATQKYDTSLADLDTLTSVGREAGRAWGLSGIARQTVLNDNGDYVSLLARVKRATGKEITPEIRDTFIKRANKLQKKREQATESKRRASKSRAQQRIRKASKLGKLAKMTETEKDAQLQSLLNQELTELTLTDIAMNLASRIDNPRIDAVVERVRALLPDVTHNQIVDAFDQAGRRKAQNIQGVETVLRNLKRQFKKEKNLLVTIDDLLYWLEQGRLPDQEISLEVDDAVVQDMQEVLDRVKKLQRDSEPWLQRRLERQISFLTTRLATKDFGTKRDKGLAFTPSKRTLDLMYEAATLDQEIGRQVQHLADKEKSWVRRGLGQGVRSSMALKSSYDDSGLFNQGGFIALGHWFKAGKTLPKALRAFVSDRAAFEIEQKILSRPNAPLYQRYNLGLTNASQASKFTAREEEFRESIAEYIPGVRASSRAFATTLNILRSDAFDLMTGADAANLGLSNIELKAAADFINMTTGRGNIESIKGTVNTLNGVFWAPRRFISRFQFIGTLGGMIEYGKRPGDIRNPGIHLRGSSQIRKMMAWEIARYLAGISAAMTLGWLAGAEFEWDPRSSDFLKMRWGKLRLDPMSGLAQTMTLISRIGAGKIKSQGKVEDLSGYDIDRLAQRFFQYKLSPAIGVAWSTLFSGQTPFDGPFEWDTEGAMWLTKSLAVPITFEDIVEGARDQGIPKGVIFSTFGMLGMGMQVHDSGGVPQSSGARRNYSRRGYKR